MATDKIKVIIVEDSGFMRILISEIIRKDKELDVIATASNGKEAVEKIKLLQPDVVVTDMVMPDYDGLYVVKQVADMATIPVILLSTLDRTDTQVFEALQSGAFDFIDKPAGRLDHDSSKSYPLIPLIKAAVKSKRGAREKARNISEHTFTDEIQYDMLVIGASTGGPGVIEFLLDNLPQNLAIPIVIAQHMPERFIDTFAERLNAKGIFKVKVAVEGESPRAGVVYLAPGHQNLFLERDSVTQDVVFKLTSERFREFKKDGTAGMQKIFAKGGYTIAQDESTSVVFGMPRAAYESGAVKTLLKLPEIPGFIVSCLS
jgi:two-component system, chemotaxis family, protein-glutamate methylesterase/glutaminase